MKASRVLATTALTLGLLGQMAMSGGSAFADPKSGELIPLTCGGTTYQVAVNGNGEFTPAHDTSSNRVFIPHAFGPITGSLYDTNNVLVDSFNEPASTQGSGKQKNDFSCTFSFSEVSDGSDPDGPPAGFRFVVSGSVTGHIAADH